MASLVATAVRPARPGCAPQRRVERRHTAPPVCAAVGSPRRLVLGQLHVQHTVSRQPTQQQQQHQHQHEEQQQQPDGPQLAAARHEAQREQQDGQPQQREWQLHRIDTLSTLLQLATPQPKRGEAAADQQRQEGSAEQQQQADVEYCGPKLRYGMQVSSRAELEAAVLEHWTATAGDRIPGTDKQESVALPGLAEVGVVSRAGREYDDWKLTNQDCHLVLPLPSTCDLATAASSDEEAPVAAEQHPRSVALGVFDGHGVQGTAASRYTRQFIATGLLRSHWRHVEGPCEGSSSSGSLDGEPGSRRTWDGEATATEGSAEAAQQLLEAAFECAGAGILSSGLELRESGSTAVVCHVEPGRVTAAWCGDSRAVLGLHVERPEAGPAVLVHPLTEDHRPDRPLERARIEAAGGQVLQVAHDSAGNPVGPFRLCGSNLYMAPRPMVSRAFGDTNAVEWGLTHTPDVVSVEFPPPARASSSGSGSSGGGAAAAAVDGGSAAGAGQDGPRHVLILGSDGFFDTTTMVDSVVTALEYPTAQEAAQALADGALRRWAVETQGVRCDDITVVVAFLPA